MPAIENCENDNSMLYKLLEQTVKCVKTTEQSTQTETDSLKPSDEDVRKYWLMIRQTSTPQFHLEWDKIDKKSYDKIDELLSFDYT